MLVGQALERLTGGDGPALYRPPIAGLYLCGAATWPGGGANPTSGALLARELLA